MREPAVCHSCATVDCIKGRRDKAVPARILQRGCELALFLPSKVGNLDCTFCLDCVQACPHDNVTIGFRVPGEELTDDRLRSSIGRLSRRADLAALAVVFTFGALLNAFAMVGPVYSTEQWIARGLRTTSEAPVLGLIFVAGLVVLPLALCSGAGFATRRLTRSSMRVKDIAVRYAYALIPFGTGVWLAHYGFHFLTGLLTIVPVAQSAAIDAAGRALAWRAELALGRHAARFRVPAADRRGAARCCLARSSLRTGLPSANRPERRRAPRLRGASLILGLAVLALWILAQPMEMRGTGLGG